MFDRIDCTCGLVIPGTKCSYCILTTNHIVCPPIVELTANDIGLPNNQTGFKHLHLVLLQNKIREMEAYFIEN